MREAHRRTCDGTGAAVNDPEWEAETADCEHIVKVCAANGLKITVGEARAAWQKHSTDWCAGWLVLPDDAAVWTHVHHWHKRDP